MPIRIPDSLPATSVLEGENIFVMTERRALHQDIRPLNLLILNLMPTKIVTETQLLRKLSNTPLQVNVQLLQTKSHTPLNTDLSHLESFYTTFDQVREGIAPEIRVIINAGDAYTSWSGGENWKDEKVVCAIRRFVDEGGGFIGVGEPSACQYQGRYFQLSDVLGADREMGFSLSTDKYNEVNREHFILEDILGEIDFGEGKSRIYAQGENCQVLDMDGKYCRLVVNEYGKGRSVYFAGLPYSPQNCRILLRAIYYAAHREEEIRKYYVSNVDTEVTFFEKTGKIAVINNAREPRQTDLYVHGRAIRHLDMAPMEMVWIDC